MKIAVIGAGIHGASSARALVRRGHEVIIFEQFERGHANGSSHGRSRIIRKAYPDAFHTRIMVDAYPLWDELQATFDREFVFHSGLVYFGESDSAEIVGVQSALTENAVPFKVLGPPACDNFGLALRSTEVGIFTPEAGWVHADLAVEASLRDAEAHGAKMVHERIASLDQLSGFDCIVITAGAWITDFVDVDVQVRVQTVAYVRADYRGPAWIEDGPDFLYGFPIAPGESGAKIGVHLRGEAWNLNEPRPCADAESIELIKDFAARRFGIQKPMIEEVVTCLYTVTPDELFRWGRLSETTFWVSACSGHGFKFGPWLGEQMADFCEGISDPAEWPEFCR